MFLNKMAYTVKDPRPPWHFLYLRETQSWRCGGGEEEKVHLKTHATTRGVGEQLYWTKSELFIIGLSRSVLKQETLKKSSFWA